jgi:hypothetical protein
LKTKLTIDCEYAIYAATKAYGLGIYGGFEVTIGAGYGKERVDFMTMNSKREFRCYEVKVSKSDFKSKCAVSFLGDFNFYVMPIELYREVKEDVPGGIGVYTVDYNKTYSGKRIPVAQMSRMAKRNSEVDRVQLMHAMVRSLSRHETKTFLAKKNEYWESDKLCGRG